MKRCQTGDVSGYVLPINGDSFSWRVPWQPIKDRRVHSHCLVDHGIQMRELLQLLITLDVVDCLELLAYFSHMGGREGETIDEECEDRGYGAADDDAAVSVI